MDLYLLRQICAVEQCGTLTAAAESLHLTQPALTRSMQKLESEVGVPLFLRRRNHTELNENGLLIVRYAHQILQLESDMIAHAQRLERGRQTFIFGSCAFGPVGVIFPLLNELYRDIPVEVLYRSECELIKSLQEGSVRFSILPYALEGSEFHCQKCGEDQLLLALPLNHPLASSHGLYMGEIKEKNMLISTKVKDGYWYHLYTEKLSSTRFLQQDDDVVPDILDASTLPVFYTTMRLRQCGPIKNRALVPILDPEASISYYLVCLSSRVKGLEPLLSFFDGRKL